MRWIRVNRLAQGVPLLFLLFAAGCSARHIQSASSLSATPIEASSSSIIEPISRETGTASWYGRDFDGKKTTSGEIFDMYAASAAHRLLPLGSIIRVTNLKNSKSITVKVNDRGPFIRNRVLELSYAAARELDFVGQGTVRVLIETLKEPAILSPAYSVLAAVFTEEVSARLLKDRLSHKYGLITISRFETNLGKFYRVMIGSYGTKEKAELVAGRLKLEGLEPIVTRRD